MSSSLHFLQIDEQGYVGAQLERLENQDQARAVLSQITIDPQNYCLRSSYLDHEIIIEAFDAPYVAHHVQYDETQKKWWLHLPYDLKIEFQLSSLKLDEWDRFHGATLEKNIPFVLTNEAQNELFDLLDEFTDDSITFQGQTYQTPFWLGDNSNVNQEHFWTEKYLSDTKPGWDLNEPAQPLKDILPQLKLLKCRILVLGCGRGHDAAYLAQQGHIVTGVDVSPEAIKEAKKLYADVAHLNFIEADLFHLPESFKHSFDVVFEHTCYCAIDPQKRNRLVKIWKELLDDGGHLLGIFFTRYYPEGPPFGGSEWELRERLKKDFHSIYWTRWKKSITPRLGVEHVIFAQKK